jgi:hypothetical protein
MRPVRNDLPPNAKLARDIIAMERAFGPDQVFWDSLGRWIQINRFWLRSSKIEFNMNPIYVVAFVPADYGERKGDGAGIEEFYVPHQLRIRRPGRAWQQVPNTHTDVDRRGGKAVGRQHLYACVHIRSFDPRRHDIATSLTALQLLLTDPEAFT